MPDKLKVVINGFGRIGRTFFRAAYDRNIEIVAINDLISTEQVAYLLQYDSIYGQFKEDVKVKGKGLQINGTLIPKLEEKDPANLPWKELAVDLVIESTGFFTDPEKAQAHIKAGAKNVIITAPCKGNSNVKTIILGVNEQEYDIKKDRIISMASCTTNCLTPVVKVLDQHFGLERSLMTTIHSYTSSQALQDGPSEKDFRRGRAAAENLVPTTTGASKATELAYPNVKGKLNAMAIRVPTPTVSLIDLTVLLKKETSKDELNQAFETAANTKDYQGAIGVINEPLVSTDFRADPHAAIIDLPSTMINGKLVKVIAWYDNEMGYSIRLAELVKYIEKQK